MKKILFNLTVKKEKSKIYKQNNIIIILKYKKNYIYILFQFQVSRIIQKKYLLSRQHSIGKTIQLKCY